MRKNRLRELLNAGKPSLGTHVHSPWPSVMELVGLSGAFDYVEYVAEYAPYDLHTFENLARAIELYDPMTSMIKVEQEPRGYLAGRAIGAGIQNVLFADVRTVDDARECVAAVRAESPDSGGQHGASMRRSSRFGADAGSPEFVQAMDDVVIALMIEKAPAVENLEALLSVDGVDMVQFGPADYSMSIGLPRQFGHEKVKAAEKHVIETALKMGVAPRAEIGQADQAQAYLDLGVRHFCVGTDVSILLNWFRTEGEAMVQILEKA
ncbi:MAG: aldolase/citrate lyase family protein [Candidatus Latescibacteria bacterium]|mgnify:CR=1 FL=1|jgi:4-hydroxy-2-oxoheptanedioate aldolase|nr:aldolase/citrate lyase family protein [Candidatus Latescibacterota bacterium]